MQISGYHEEKNYDDEDIEPILRHMPALRASRVNSPAQLTPSQKWAKLMHPTTTSKKMTTT